MPLTRSLHDLGAAIIALMLFAASHETAYSQTGASPPQPRELCPDRPGLGTPACTTDKGQIVVELGVGDWTRDSDAGTTSDVVTVGEWLIRVGVTDSLEAQLGWTSYGHARIRQTGSVTKDSGNGDVTIALRQNLRNPDGSKTAIAVMPYVTLPAGASPLGAGDWGAGLLVLMSFELPQGLSLALTPRIDAAVDSDGEGRHLAFGSVIGLGFAISDAVSGAAELSVVRDCDPHSHDTTTLAGLSLGWQPDDDLQLDAGINLGLNRNSPDSEIYFGIVRRF